MPSSEWERGYAAGYAAAHRTDVRDITVDRGDSKPPRKKNAYNAKYSRAFKKVEGRYKKKNGGWVKDGFRLCQKAAHKLAKKM